jgi:hypothetical protein
MTASTAHCENCTAPLQGDYCHRCGQSVHNPIRHARHALEEFFEAFWHLDGRLWRTLRDLMVPGRTAGEYLAGHRARYIPPLRLFVVLSVLTFFMGALTVDFQPSATLAAESGVPEITQAQTVAEVERERDRLLADIEQARADSSNVPGVNPFLIAAEVKIRGEAANRIAELRPAGTADPQAAPAAPVPSGGELFSAGHAAWDPALNPVDIAWLPGFANAWLTDRQGVIRDNVARMGNRPAMWFKAFMGSVPSALFVLVPVFALLLKLAYVFRRRLYLEHMVVALYSHAFLLIALAAAFVLSAVDRALTPVAGWLGVLCSLLFGAVLTWMPVYLLLMQKRVYRQGWGLTVLKYLAIGFVYFWLLLIAAGLMFLVRLAQA